MYLGSGYEYSAAGNSTVTYENVTRYYPPPPIFTVCDEWSHWGKYQEERKENKMRSLYRVYVVDPRKQGKLLDMMTVIAESDEKALLKADVVKVAEAAGLELEQVDTFVECVGTFIRPRKETSKVKIVKEDED